VDVAAIAAGFSTYLISFVAGEYKEKQDTWRNIPIAYYVPRGMEDTIDTTFSHTKQMLDFFSERYGVAYPWEKIRADGRWTTSLRPAWRM